MIDFLVFRRMITPIIIQIIFWIGVVICLIMGIVMIAQGADRYGGGGAQVLIGVLVLLIGPVYVRITCELMILFFRMNETLTDILGTLKGRSSAPPALSAPPPTESKPQ